MKSIFSGVTALCAATLSLACPAVAGDTLKGVDRLVLPSSIGHTSGAQLVGSQVFKEQRSNLRRLVQFDARQGITRDYLVIVDRPIPFMSTHALLQQCSKAVSELLVDEVALSSDNGKLTRHLKVISCSEMALSDSDRLARLKIAQQYYSTNAALDKPFERRAVQSIFASAIERF